MTHHPITRSLAPRLLLTFALFLSALALGPRPLAAQEAAAPSAGTANPSKTTPSPEFLAAADEVLKEMSQITGWPLKTPLKKTLRSREEIRAYVVQQMNDEKDAKERYASTRSAEAFGLIPKNFDMDNFLVELLSEQIAGLYDPKAHEFYIADWIAPEEQRMVMSHELTHALEDQRYQIEAWEKAARPNDDAELARGAVLEGSATAAMVAYMLKEKGLDLRDLPEFDPSMFLGELSETPTLKKAPRFIKNSLMFPYLDGLNFSMNILRRDGWKGFDKVFANPPAGTNDILHPDHYRSGHVVAPLKLDLPGNFPGKEWNKLEENYMGEFGWKEVLAEHANDAHARMLVRSWDGDMYATWESPDKKRLLLAARIRFADEEAAERFFEGYSGLLRAKHPPTGNYLLTPDFLSFETPEGGIFLRCSGRECITLQGGRMAQFMEWSKALGWKTAPLEEPAAAAPQIKTAGGMERLSLSAGSAAH